MFGLHICHSGERSDSGIRWSTDSGQARLAEALAKRARMARDTRI